MGQGYQIHHFRNFATFTFGCSYKYHKISKTYATGSSSFDDIGLLDG